MKHICVKPGCGAKYEDNDPDDYYCPAHLAEKKAIALEIDKRMGSRVSNREVKPVFSGRDFVGANGRIMFNADGMRI